ncbi:hypothetical protein [Kineothrix sp. MB12-C1]|uniref:hypothetical protein n=1 Tax=Kineothrix sp. MB12-C1 TaxID=3070215 RepID=UPI0027D2A614|nr:hypothetical protein [Kineothrix sp. MB12-C1]WMC93938.1 hypothetical protein RBB56_06660 [Kineothrix sp. MB12-C1]
MAIFYWLERAQHYPLIVHSIFHIFKDSDYCAAWRIVFSMLGGNRTVSHTVVTYGKYFLFTVAMTVGSMKGA